MTEAEWLACEAPDRMLKFLRGKGTDRKLRLFSVAGCRRIWHLLTDHRSRRGVELAEQFADRLISEQELEAAAAQANVAKQDAILSRQASDYTVPEMYSHGARAAWFTTTAEEFTDAEHALAIVAACSLIAHDPTSSLGSRESERTAQSSLLREIVGNPFRPVTFDPTWRTTAVLLLARGIYEERAFDRMPILADALQDAGCDSDDILSHLRDANAAHVRGCWALDLVLEKE